MPKKIPLTQDKFAIVDDEDFERLNQYKWCAKKTWRKKYKDYFYAVRTVKIKGRKLMVFMHREILGLSYGNKKLSDHKNHNGLDNRKINLRVCSKTQNGQNQRTQERKKTSKYKGVCWYKRCKKWIAKIKYLGNTIYLGLFESEEEAALTYDKKAKELFGEFALLNLNQSKE